MQQVDNRMMRRGLRADGSGPLPQFDLGRWDAFDPDRTLQRFAIAPDAAPTPVWLGATDDYVGPASAPDAADLAVTVEIVPEIDVDDILEAAPVARPPLVLPPRTSLPLDLDRLLAQARSETRKSVDYFHPSTPMAPPVVSVARPAVTSGRADPTVAIARMPDPFQPPNLSERLAASAATDRRRRFGWVVGTVVAAAVATVAVAAVQSRVSSARSPESVVVNQPIAAAAPAALTTTVTAAPTNEIPTVSFQSLPPAPSGTISLAAVAASHRLFVDGHLAAGDSQVVSCGRHLVQVGSRGVKHYVDVPCGQEVVLAK